jgi:hypothetical protein
MLVDVEVIDIDTGMGQEEEKEPKVAISAPKLSSPRHSILKRLEMPPPGPTELPEAQVLSAGEVASTECMEVVEQLVKKYVDVAAAGTSTAGNSSLALTEGETQYPDAALFEDPLLHDDQVSCML